MSDTASVIVWSRPNHVNRFEKRSRVCDNPRGRTEIFPRLYLEIRSSMESQKTGRAFVDFDSARVPCAAVRLTFWLQLLLLACLPRLQAREDETREKARGSRPNVVLIIADDQAWGDYGFLGHETIRTPHIDRLARESAVWARGYVPSSLCRPSLATIITGLYPHQHGIVGNDPRHPSGAKAWTKRRDAAYRPLLENLTAHIDRVPTLPRLLAKRGYRSHQSGKWWEGSWRRGGFTAGMTHGDIDRGGRHGDEGLRIGRKGLQPIFDFIESSADDPFFVWYAPFLPHTPHNPPKRLLDKYRDRCESIHVAKYQAMCEWFDETVGQLLGYLDTQGLAENTLVVYVCDNGWIQHPKAGRYAPRSKRSQYDGGVRTPILLRWPGKIEPKRHEGLASSVDLAPTILRACGLEPSEAMSGVDLVAVAKGDAPPRQTVYGDIYEHDVFEIGNPGANLLWRYCVEGDWKLIVSSGRVPDGSGSKEAPPAIELFRLSEDPNETTELSARHPEVVERLRKKLDTWWKP